MTFLQKAAQKRRHRRHREHQYALASGIDNVSDVTSAGPFRATNAGYLSAETYVADYQYVEEEYGDESLLGEALRGVVWAHRLTQRSPPCAEQILLYERAITTQEQKDHKKKDRRVQKAKEQVSEPMPNWAPGVSRTTVQQEAGARRHVSSEERAVRLPLESSGLRQAEGSEMTHPPELKEQARALRAEGLLIKEIAEQLPVPFPTLIRWLNPELEARERAKARKKKFSQRRRCPVCKKKMSNNAARCVTCFNKEQKYWTRDRVVEAIQRWAVEKGAPPSYQEWILSGPEHPAIWTIISGKNPAFPSWGAAIKAAGFEPRKRRRPGLMTRQERADMRRRAREETLKRALRKGNDEHADGLRADADVPDEAGSASGNDVG